MLVKVRLDQYLKCASKIQKKEKPAHIVVLCHILTIQVDKQGLYTFRRKNHVSTVISQTMAYELKGEEKGFWTGNMIILKSSPKYHLGVIKKGPTLLRAKNLQFV